MNLGNPGGKFSPKIFSGAVFGRLTVVERLPVEKGKHRNIHRVLCNCSCGEQSKPEVNSLLSGKSTSCGCKWTEGSKRSSRNKIVPGERRGKVIPGAKFGRLTVIEREEVNGNYTGRVSCNCNCGSKCYRTIDAIAYGFALSCGCLTTERLEKQNKERAKYGGFTKKYPKTNSSWRSMLCRCENKNSHTYASYGAKGIRVCQGFHDIRRFIKAIGIRKKARPSLDRFPVHNGHYSCGECDECKANEWKLNVRWATRREQSENRGSFNVWIEAFGQKKTQSQWMALSGLNWGCLARRLKRGWTPEKALTTPDKKGHCYVPQLI